MIKEYIKCNNLYIVNKRDYVIFVMEHYNHKYMMYQPQYCKHTYVKIKN